ncbi:unnamed protein product [Discosporangium mesarthrocarpum]
MARRFQFIFAGDSTTRRLADSFEAVYKGSMPSHHTDHKTVEHNVNELSAVFKWTPHCEELYGEIAENIEILRRKRVAKQLVFVTSYGVHDICGIREFDKEAHMSPEQTHVLEDAALGRCLYTTQSLIDLAREGAIVMVMEGNPFGHWVDENRVWMGKLHQQRMDLFKGETHNFNLRSQASGRFQMAMPFMVEDQANLFDRLECKRKDSIHFYEPVKLTQAQMLWHLMNIVFRCSLDSCV